MAVEAYLIRYKDNHRMRGVRLAENMDHSCTSTLCEYLPLVLQAKPQAVDGGPRRCPFCGGKAHHTLGARRLRIPDAVQCLGCFAEIQGTYDPNSALEKWNAVYQGDDNG